MEAKPTIDLTRRLEGIDAHDFEKLVIKASELKMLSKKTSQLVQLLPTQDQQNVVANYAYLIYEYLELNKTRKGANYTFLKEFASKYRSWLDYILDGNPVRYKMNVWLREPEQMTEMGMYARTNRHNKNVYH